MTTRSNFAPSHLLGTIFVLGAALLFASPARAAWGTAPVEVYSTLNACPQVATASDGARGAMVLWQEAITGDIGMLRAQHLLATGDIDLSWGGPVVVSDSTAARSALVALADGTGGAYACWLEGLSVYLTHLDSNGVRSAGWPARGRYLGVEYDAGQRPSVLADGAGGVYVSWHQPSDPTPAHVDLMLAHLGPDNAAAGGFPASGVRTVGARVDRVEWVCTSAIDLAPDHGVWVAWGTSVRNGLDPLPGAFRLLRLTPAGEPAPGWVAYGVELGVFDSDRLEYEIYITGRWKLFNGMSLIGVASDGADGAFVDRGDVEGYSTPEVAPRLLHYGANGALAAGWPAGGVLICNPFGTPVPISMDMGYGGSLRALSDGMAGVYASYSGLWYADTPAIVRFDRYNATASRLSGGAGAYLPDLMEVIQSGDGGLLTASCKPWGRYSQWEPPASIGCGLSNAGGYYEYHDALRRWYGDVGVTPTGDGGAIFCWSQFLERQGVYAVRLLASGLADVPGPPAVVAPRLSLWFAPGEGVRVHAGFDLAGEARFVLADVAGRAAARERFAATAGEREWVLPGTATLPAGLYFARIENAGRTLNARVIVTR